MSIEKVISECNSNCDKCNNKLLCKMYRDCFINSRLDFNFSINVYTPNPSCFSGSDIDYLMLKGFEYYEDEKL